MTRSRDVRPYLEDIADSIARIGRYTEGIGVDDFLRDDVLQDATIRRIEIVGEAVGSAASYATRATSCQAANHLWFLRRRRNGDSCILHQDRASSLQQSHSIGGALDVVYSPHSVV